MKLCFALFIIGLSVSGHVESKWDRRPNERDRDQDWPNRKESSLEWSNQKKSDDHWSNRIERGLDKSDRKHSEHDWNKESKIRLGRHAERKIEHKEMTNEIPTIHKYARDPPDHTELVPMARYVIHNADWASIATISTLPAIEGFPFSNVKSMSDGYIANSTGIPYFYMSPLDFTARDLKRNTRASVLATLEETKYCAQKEYDAEDPRCTRVMLSGKMKRVKENTTEYDFAKGALFERHPSMANFPADHDFFVAKLKIAQIAMVDWFGGAKYISVRDYLAYNYTENEVVNKLRKSQDTHVTVERTNLQ